MLYDDFGKLCLRNIANMKREFLVDRDVSEDIDYSSSIDSQTYNKVKLAYENSGTGKRDVFIAQDGEAMNRWGVLQYYESVQTETGAAQKADALLKLYNRKTRTLTVKGVLGDVSVRAGTLVPVSLHLGDIVANTFMLAEKVKHTFRENEHLMDLTLIGGDFIA